jgi:hypothetical protein
MVERLSTVCKVLFDQQLVELRKENEELKAKLAVLEYGDEALNRALADVNSNGLTEVCRCEGCFHQRRFEGLHLADVPERFPFPTDEGCIIKRCLKAGCESIGLVCTEFNEEDEDFDAENEEPDYEDCHLLLVREGGNPGWSVWYGRRLDTSRDFHLHPDLPKLKTLFEKIGEKEEFFQPCPGTLRDANERWQTTDLNSP